MQVIFDLPVTKKLKSQKMICKLCGGKKEYKHQMYCYSCTLKKTKHIQAYRTKYKGFEEYIKQCERSYERNI